MTYLHSNSIIHRDLTSNNIFLRKNSGTDILFTALIGDFGLALSSNSSFTSTVPRRIIIEGTPFWMAPECLRGDSDYDEMIDVFSFGIVVCQTIARIEADPDDLPRTQAFGVDHAAFRSLCSPDVPPLILHVAFDCCSVEPGQRP